MTGLNLETFLQLLRADAGAWTSLALILGLLALMTWTSWGSRRALRKCLVLSILAHTGLILYGGANPERFFPGGSASETDDPAREPTIRSIQVARVNADGTITESETLAARTSNNPTASAFSAASPLSPDLAAMAGLDIPLRADRPQPAAPVPSRDAPPLSAITPEAVTPEVSMPIPEAAEPRLPEVPAPEAPQLAQADPGDVSLSTPEPSPTAPAATSAPRTPEVATRVGRPQAAQTGLRPTLARPGSDLSIPSTDPIALASPSASNTAPETTTPTGNPAEPGPPPSADGLAMTPAEPGPDAGAIPPGARPLASTPAPELVRPDVGALRAGRPSFRSTGRNPSPTPNPAALALNPADLASGTPGPAVDLVGPRGNLGTRSLDDIPTVYRPRLDPNRAQRARQAGASDASEQAVERALAWMAAHQDTDGRWDAGTARYNDGTSPPDDDNFTSHCPPGDICHGECFYWEADTAVSGLALLTFLGAGYTHQDGGKYSRTIARGIDFLLAQQKTDGDLRGKSRAVGMYCHTMATLALSEALALTGDPRLQQPVQRAVDFLVQAQYPSQLGWRYTPASEISRKAMENNQGWTYQPHPPVGDTSVLGWVVMCLKSASEVGLDVPASGSRNALGWLTRVSEGTHGGLARYQPSRPHDPTMSAEAWVCRQFLGTGGPGDTSDESAAYLLENAPSRDQFNIYYWYYGTLAMYQHGGPNWQTWNGRVRDALVQLQRQDGHKNGSWDPDPTRYGTHGGRLYTTALATLTLEVYYRYLRLYDTPALPTSDDGGLPQILPPITGGDSSIRRTGNANNR